MTENLSSSVHSRITMAHCECVLTLFMVKKLMNSSFLEISVSKACCWPCLVFLEELSRTENFIIFVSATHCKTDGGWQFPSNSEFHQSIYHRMITRNEDNVSGFLGSAQARRRSDSQFVSSSDEAYDEVRSSIWDQMDFDAYPP